jgi:glycosyltransferase involved in cell wall biosynthesis
MSTPKHIAIVHDWLVSMRGGEKVLEGLCELFPGAELFTLVYRRGKLTPKIERMSIKTSFIQRLPLGKEKYQYYLPLYPQAVRRLDLRGFDLVVSSSSAAAKAVRIPPGALHICYCHTPMRYIWDQFDEYFGPGKSSLPVRTLMRMVRSPLQSWDRKTSRGVHHFIAKSQNVQERIRRLYGRESTLIYPPVDIDRFTCAPDKGGYFLIVSALVPYKRIELAVTAFNELGERLIIAGEGMERRKLHAIAKTNIEFTGMVSDDQLRGLYENSRALVFPGEEDFGIVPVEAMACGKPVIAYGKGGALETVVDGVTGVFFRDQTVSGLIGAVRASSNMQFHPQRIREHAQGFHREVFLKRISAFIREKWDAHSSPEAAPGGICP